MSPEQTAVSYDQFFLKPVKERLKIFNEISPDNRASIIKTQSERWLAANRYRLTAEQIAVVEEAINAISPEWYKPNRDSEDVHPEAETMVKKVEAVLSPKDLLQLTTRRADYIPFVKDEND